MNYFPLTPHHHAKAYTLTTVTPAVSEPVTVGDLRSYCKIDLLDDAERTLLVRFGTAGRQQIEAACKGLVMMNSTFRVSVNDWPSDGRITLPRRPVQSIASVTYLDASGTTQTLPTSNYTLDLKDPFSSVRFIGTLPTLAASITNRVSVTFTAGIGATAADVPDDLKLAIGAWCLTNYDQRETVTSGNAVAVMPYAFKAILDIYSAPEV